MQMLSRPACLRSAVAVSGALAFLLAAGCVVSVDSTGVKETVERRFTVGEMPEIGLVTFDGAIEIRTWDRSEVVVEVEKRGHDQEAVDSIEVHAEQNGNRIRVEVRRPEGRDSFVGIGVHISRSGRVVASVPRRSNLMARTGDGSITVERAAGRLELRTEEGSVRGIDLEGDLTVQTRDGSVTLDSVTGRLDLVADDGRVNVTGRPEVVRVRSGDGSISIRAEEGSVMADDWDIRTEDGSIAIYLPETFDATLDAHASDGSIRSDLDVKTDRERDRHTIRGRLGGGGHVLRLRTGDGSITLRTS